MPRSAPWAIATAAIAIAALVFARPRSSGVDPDALDALGVRLDAIERRLAERDAAPPPAALEGELGRLTARVAELEAAPRRAAVADPTPEPRAAVAEAAAPAEPTGPTDAERAELDELIDWLQTVDWSDVDTEKYERFLELARDSNVLAAAIADLERAVELDPDDVDLRMELADHYIGKLMTVSGPEQGVWGAKAERQWKSVLERDDAHADAHASLGVSYSFYPEVLGKTGDAITHLERALDLSRGLPAEPGGQQLYLSLSTLRLRQADRDRARATLQQGLAAYPGDAQLLSALEQLEP